VPFHSILFDRPQNRVDVDEREEPSFFADLNLDQVLESMTAGRGEYNLKPLFYAPLRDVEAVHSRHDILRDLEQDKVFESVGDLTRKMQEMRKHLAQAEKLHYQYQKERWFLDAVEIYCDAVSTLTEELTSLDVKSRGFLAFLQYLTIYTMSDGFTALVDETKKLQESLANVRYCLHIKDNRSTSSPSRALMSVLLPRLNSPMTAT
jgi:DNA mismatch repair protein MutS